MIDDKMINDKAAVYFKKKIAIHITKNDGEWLNGMIAEFGSNFFMLDENKKGKMPVFFSEIKNIETFQEDGE